MSKGVSMKSRKGQGLTEYIIVVALVAIAAIGVVNIFGNQLRNQFATIVGAMSGHTTSKVTDLKSRADSEKTMKDLGDYAKSKQ